MATGIKVIGLRDFQLRIRKAEEYKPALMREGLNEVGQIIVETAVPMMESKFVTDPARRTGALERSVKARSTTREGRVVAGTPVRVPYAGWWEFGGSTKRKAGGMDRHFFKRGRSLYPALDKQAEAIYKALDAVLNRLADILNED